MSTEIEKPQHHLPSLALRTLATSNTLTMSSDSLAVSKVSSPVTNLTLNLSELSTGTGRDTPRRKLSLTALDTPTPSSSSHPTPERSDSTESGCFMDSPSPVDSPTLEQLQLKRLAGSHKAEIPPEAFTKKKTIAFRRFNSMPVPMMMRLSPVDLENERENEVMAPKIQAAMEPMEEACNINRMTIESSKSTQFHSVSPSSLSPVFNTSPRGKKAIFYLEETSSQDSGVDFDRDSRDSKDLDDGFEFAAPVGVPRPSRRTKIISEDTCSPFKYSPVKDSALSGRRSSCPVGSLDFSGEVVKQKEDNLGSPLKVSRLASMEEDVDDGFLDIMDEEVAKLTTTVPTTLTSLFNNPVLNEKQTQDDDDTPVTTRVLSRRFLHRSQSLDVRSKMSSFKRDPPQDESTPIQRYKRQRPASFREFPSPVQEPARPVLHRCHSESEAMIKSALNRISSEPDLVGDCSRPYILPTIPGKHHDLKCVSSHTMSEVVNGCFDHVIEKAIIVDCRYPYEYNGGHLKGAENIYTCEAVLERFLKNPIKPTDSNKRIVLVFHCEFSSERGPKLSRFLRQKDREANKDCYPVLHYPEIYLLEGGYKNFYETHKEDCFPQTYMPMLHKDHSADLRHFRAKSKSWSGVGRQGMRPLRF